MTLARQLQHLDDINVCDAFGAVGWCGSSSLPYLPLIQYVILIPPQYGRSEYASSPSRLPGLKIKFISPIFQCIHYVSSTSCPSYSHRPAGTAPSDPNRDEPPYKYVDACGCIWVRLVLSFPRFRSCYVFCGFDSNWALGTHTSRPHMAHARLPAVFGAISVFDLVHFLPAPPIHSAQIDSATILIPKAKLFGETSGVCPAAPPPLLHRSLTGGLPTEKNLCLFVHASLSACFREFFFALFRDDTASPPPSLILLLVPLALCLSFPPSGPPLYSRGRIVSPVRFKGKMVFTGDALYEEELTPPGYTLCS
ncbi:hypothetical protein B0H13DRAFT_2343174 [Mycena leptocephala]|nr:hypothetical protein B0H13DRAFT_2343174 [Mycena leptocephala]